MGSEWLENHTIESETVNKAEKSMRNFRDEWGCGKVCGVEIGREKEKNGCGGWRMKSMRKNERSESRV